MSITHQLVTLSAKKIVGIETRTSNEAEMLAGPSGKIAGLWQQFLHGGLNNDVNNKISDKVFAVYTKYESDFTGPYSLIIGYEVAEGTNPPAGAVAVALAADRYLKFTAADNSPAAVMSLWQYIWQFFTTNTSFKRCYTTDFELYDFANTKAVEIYIAVEQIG